VLVSPPGSGRTPTASRPAAASLGVTLSPKRKPGRSGRPRTISADDAPVAVLVVPTNEELEIAEQTFAAVGG
jgi:acetate kinase